MQSAAPPMPIPKPSQRRWYVVGGFLIAALATPFLYVVIVGQWREHQLEQIYREMDAQDPHWRWADLIKQRPPAPPDERNAFIQLQKVIAIKKATPFVLPFGNKPPVPVNARLKDADELRLRAALVALTPTTLEEARKLKDMPEGRIVLDPAAKALAVEFGALAILRVMQILEHDAMLHAQDGKPDKAANACLAIVRSAHAIGDFPQLMAQLVRTAGLIAAAQAIERTLGNGTLDEKQLEVLQAAVAAEAEQDGICQAFLGERAGVDEYYQSLRDGRISAEKFISDMGLDRTQESRLYRLFPSLLMRGYPEALRMKNEILRACKLKVEDRISAFRKIQETRQTPTSRWDTLFLLNQIQDIHVDHARVRCAVAAIAAERYRLEHDQWPTGIAELLKEGLLKEPITDPYDGQPLRFRRTDTGLMVYSIGQDKTDNLGRTGDIAFELWLPIFRGVAAPADAFAR